MTDNQLIAILIVIINNGLTADGFTGIPVIQSNQPTQQGVVTSPVIFLSKSKDYWYGWQQETSVYDPVNDVMNVSSRQRVETTFEFGARAIQDPTDTSLPTASDLLNEVGAIIRSPQTIQYLATLDLGLLRTTEVSNKYDLDDRDQFEATPIFQTTIVHSRTRITQVPVIESTELDVVRV